jgi:hypothetical protein
MGGIAFGDGVLGSGVRSRPTPGPFFEGDIKRGSEDTLENGGDSQCCILRGY